MEKKIWRKADILSASHRSIDLIGWPIACRLACGGALLSSVVCVYSCFIDTRTCITVGLLMEYLTTERGVGGGEWTGSS